MSEEVSKDKRRSERVREGQRRSEKVRDDLNMEGYLNLTLKS